MPTPPREPTRDECCGRGCEPCIFDYYDRALDRWETRVRALGHDPAQVLAAYRA
ncbi:oxidoreductase-like domain-containing protein [Phenylobacterium sp. J426]|nr:oxidoreductase-like domain-containing protein [Phenylobacterium sp. J426]MCR5873922.1 oxidoreductase-like domain-containing protein [Phenylobacterium sp. J426]